MSRLDPFRPAERQTQCPQCGELLGWNKENGLAGQRCVSCGYTFTGHERKQAGTRRVDRAARLLPEGKPRYVHCYDNGGKSADRYTVVFTGRYRKRTAGEFLHIGANANPFHPQGIGMHCSSPTQIDWPTYGHLGKKITFDQLPDDVQRLA